MDVDQIAEAIARDTACAQGEFEQRRIAVVGHLMGTGHELAAALFEVERLREMLGAIESMCSEEIKTRFPPHHSKTEEELAGKSVIYTMLALPRNMARAALTHQQLEENR